MKSVRKIPALILFSSLSIVFLIGAIAAPSWITCDGNTRGLFILCPKDKACVTPTLPIFIQVTAAFVILSLIFDLVGLLSFSLEAKSSLTLSEKNLTFRSGVVSSVVAIVLLLIGLLVFTNIALTFGSDDPNGKLLPYKNDTTEAINEKLLGISGNKENVEDDNEDEAHPTNFSDQKQENDFLKQDRDLENFNYEYEDYGQATKKSSDARRRKLTFQSSVASREFGYGFWMAWTCLLLMVIRLALIYSCKCMPNETASKKELYDMEEITTADDKSLTEIM